MRFLEGGLEGGERIAAVATQKHTQLWDRKIKKVKDTGDYGDIEHLRSDMLAKDVRQIRLNANDLCWLVLVDTSGVVFTDS